MCRKSGIRWLVLTLMKLHQLFNSKRNPDTFTTYSAEGRGSLFQEGSVGEKSEAGDSPEEEAPVANSCMHMLVLACQHLHLDQTKALLFL